MTDTDTTAEPTDTTTWVDVLAADALAAEPTRVEVDGTSVVIARTGDRVLAALDRCPHRGTPLSAGTVEHDCIVCPYHGWAFDGDGEIVGIPALGDQARLPRRARLTTVAVAERDGRVLVDAASLPSVPVPRRSVGNDDVELRPGWHPVGRVDELPADGEATFALLGDTWTVHRDPAGTLTATARTPLPQIAPTRSGPGRRPQSSVAGAHVREHLGHVWIAPEPPRADLLDIPEFAEEGWHHVPMPRVEGRYGMGLLLDNQLDAGHFSFVHRNTFGSAADAALPPYEVERDGPGFDVTMRVPIAARNDVTSGHDGRPLTQHRTMTYRYRAPSTLFLRLDYEEMGGSTGILFCFTPLDRDTTRMDVDLLFRHPDGFTAEQLAERLAFECQVVGEDLALQDRFEFLDLPLDLTAEIHTRVDKAAVEMRRILADLYRESDVAATPAPEPTPHHRVA